MTNCFRHEGWQRENDFEGDTLPSIAHEYESLVITDEAIVKIV